MYTTNGELASELSGRNRSKTCRDSSAPGVPTDERFACDVYGTVELFCVASVLIDVEAGERNQTGKFRLHFMSKSGSSRVDESPGIECSH